VKPPRILIVVTSWGEIDGEPQTGIWFSEFAEPLAIFQAEGAAITVASPRGGPAPIDPRGYPAACDIAAVRDGLAMLNATRPLEKMLAADFDGIFMPGGHGPMFDLAVNPALKALISSMWGEGKAVGAVCHGPAALLNVRTSGGTTLLHGRRVTGFTHAEDATDPLFPHLPFALQTFMVAEGSDFVAAPPGSPHVEIDGNLVTGQNPASAEATAKAFLAVLANPVIEPQ